MSLEVTGFQGAPVSLKTTEEDGEHIVHHKAEGAATEITLLEVKALLALIQEELAMPVPAKTKYVSAAYGALESPYFSTIQAAVDAAVAGDHIVVYPGTYNEQVTLKNGVHFSFRPGVTIESNAAS